VPPNSELHSINLEKPIDPDAVKNAVEDARPDYAANVRSRPIHFAAAAS
jgi:hypothetical protein|tara:strand:- start:47 stop:193 length:147 start_codon:yes stop_codon:yes gene_type:complete